METYLDIQELELLDYLRSFNAVTTPEAIALKGSKHRYYLGKTRTLDLSPLKMELNAADEVNSVFTEKESKGILNYLLTIIPSMLRDAFDITSDESTGKKLFGTKKLYDTRLKGFIDNLSGMNIPNTEHIENLLKYDHYPFPPETWGELTEFIYRNRATIKRNFSLNAWTVMKNLFAIMDSAESIDERYVAWLKKTAIHIPDKLLSRYIKSLNMDSKKEDKKALFDLARKSEKEITKKYFKKENPSLEDAKALQESSPERYKEWRTALRATKSAAKDLIESIFKDRGYDIIDVEIAHKIMKENGISDPIDPGFEGKVGLGTTRSMMFSYYTSYGKPLESVVGVNVVMNPQYNESDNTYYCTHMPPISKTGIPIKVYTKEHKSKSSQRLHNAARESLESLEDVRATFANDIKVILNGRFKKDRKDIPSTRALCALVCRVMDETAGRIGNADSARMAEPTYGIHNLLVRHIRVLSNSIKVSYIGKDAVPQSHVIKDPDTIRAIEILIQDRTKDQPIFSKDGETCVSPSTVGQYLASTGFPGSPHLFRKLWANKIFHALSGNEIEVLGKKAAKIRDKIAKAKKGEDVKSLKARLKEVENLIKGLWDKATDAVGAKLGHTKKSTSIANYIDPMAMMRFWNTAGMKAPTSVVRAYEKMAFSDPNKDD